jgi:LPS export ABC transporter protein LptC
METVKSNKKNKKALFPPIITFRACCLLCTSLLFACSFDYGAGTGLENTRPDIVMENIEYVRVRGGDMLARFQAEHAERWEELQIMELRNFTFEQMEDHGETVNVEGAAKAATVQIDTGDISLSGGVRISIESEDIIINTAELEWKDKEKTIKGGAEEEVDVKRSDGTTFIGKGFSADIRSRTWAFTGEVKGSYVEKDENK